MFLAYSESPKDIFLYTAVSKFRISSLEDKSTGNYHLLGMILLEVMFKMSHLFD